MLRWRDHGNGILVGLILFALEIVVTIPLDVLSRVVVGQHSAKALDLLQL